MIARAGVGFLAALVAAVLAPRSVAAADIRLAPVFSDGMVVQRGAPVIVWGNAAPDATVEVTVGDERQSATAGADGTWRVSLPALSAGTKEITLTASSAGHSASVRHMLVGDVWLCAGQSNMQMTLRETEGGPEIVRDAAKLTRIHLLMIPKRPASTPQTAFDSKWQNCSPKSAASFSAVGFYFGLELLHSDAVGDVPIGLIDCSFGGTAAEAWTSKEGLGGFAPGDLLPSMFGIAPGQIFNGMVAPLAPFPVKGVLWYQGESNGSRPDLYARVLSNMTADWRKRWNEPELPFLIVQLPPFVDSHFTWIREAQGEVAKATPHTAMAVTIDTTDGYNLHPKQKHEIGRRLALLARRMVYHENLIASGPVFKDATVDGGNMRLTFDTQGDGLAIRGGQPGTRVKGFSVAGADGEYRYADATIDGDSVRVHCDAVPEPKTVRYAWDGIPDANLTNRSGLPAAPFRTDRLPRSMIEIRKQSAPRRVSMPVYDFEIDGEGKITSLIVRGQQFLSNEPGGAGGTSIPAFFGPRSLPDVRELGPDLLSCSDNEIALTLSFRDQSMEWTIANHSAQPIDYHVALAARVDARKSDDGSAMILSRGKSTLRITGIDTITGGADAKVLQTKIPPGQTRRLTLGAAE